MKFNESQRVAFYIRVSTEEQSKTWFWAELQLKWLQELMVFRAQHSAWIHEESWEYIDLGCTGADLDRPAYKKMMEDAKKGKFDVVAVWKIDRLSRNLTHLLKTFESLKNFWVSFFSLKENIDFSGAIGRLTFQIFGALAEFERETIKMRTQEWKRASARLGNYVNPTTPYGYKRVKSVERIGRTSLEIVPEEAIYVEKVFKDFIAWKSLEGIARAFNDLSVLKSKTNKVSRHTSWTGGGIKTIVCNSTYAWVALYNDTDEHWETSIIEIPVPPIVSYLTFELAKKRLDNLHETTKTWGGKETYLLSRKIVDLETGRKYVGLHRTKWGHSYRRKQFFVEGKKYPNREIPGEALEKFVWAKIEEMANDPERLFDVYQRQSLSESNFEELSKERDQNLKKIENLKAWQCVLERRFCDGDISEEIRDANAKQYKIDENKIRAKNASLDETLDAIVEAQATKQALESFRDKYQGSFISLSLEDKQNLVDILVEKIEVKWDQKQASTRVLFRYDPRKLLKTNEGPHSKKASTCQEEANESFEKLWMVGDSGLEPLASSMS
jgi:site-specific DNA recombinase